MKVKALVYVVANKEGAVDHAVCESSSDIVQFHISNGENLKYFESEAYHLDSWTKEHGFQLLIQDHEIDVDLSSLTVNSLRS